MRLASERPIAPAIMAFLSAALWGLWWMPIRYLETLGMSGAWGSVAMNSGAALAAVLWMLWRRISPRVAARGLAGAALVGVAVTSYSVAITMADVVRVILLFYLAPAWGKVIEWAFMGQPWRWTTTLTLAASLTGAYFVLGGDVSLASIGPGDVLAVLSGMAWAAGAALIFTSKRSSPMSLTLATAGAAAVLGLAFIWLGAGIGVSGGHTAPGGLAGAGFGAVYVLPILALTLWSAQRLSPALISFLLTAEILSGVGSGALFLDEPFGPMQMTGAALVFLAALSEVLPQLRKARPAG